MAAFCARMRLATPCRDSAHTLSWWILPLADGCSRRCRRLVPSTASLSSSSASSFASSSSPTAVDAARFLQHGSIAERCSVRARRPNRRAFTTSHSNSSNYSNDSNSNINNNQSGTATTAASKGEGVNMTSSNDIRLDFETNAEVPGAMVGIITLNRPKANAMGRAMIQQFQDILDRLEQDSRDTSHSRNNCSSSSSSSNDEENLQQQQQQDRPQVRCLVLTSYSNNVFSAGADLKERSTMTLEEAETFVTLLRNTMHRFSQLPIPSIAAVEGIAVGGGLEMALAADLRIASHDAIFGLPECGLAIVPGAGGTQRLPRLIGPARAKQLIWTSERISAATALQYGLIQELVEPGAALRTAFEWAWKIARNGPVGIRASKYAIDYGIEASTMREALAIAIERDAYQQVLPTQDRLEGLAAFREGRTPVFQGR